ncbi:MAG: CBS domain-containing protein [Desulfobacterales bacterium]
MEKNINRLPIVGADGKPVGIVTRSDLVNFFFYAIMPAGLGALVMLIIALLINNIAPNRRYPEFWL